MPTYEYICKGCGHLFEIVQSMRDDALTECPQCGGALRKVFAPPAIAFKGPGFYATDSRQRAKPAPTDKKKEAAAGTTDAQIEKKAEKKTETSTEKKVHTKSSSDGSGGSSGTDAKM